MRERQIGLINLFDADLTQYSKDAQVQLLYAGISDLITVARQWRIGRFNFSIIHPRFIVDVPLDDGSTAQIAKSLTIRNPAVEISVVQSGIEGSFNKWQLFANGQIQLQIDQLRLQPTGIQFEYSFRKLQLLSSNVSKKLFPQS